MMERRVFRGKEVRAVKREGSNTSTIEGYAAVFNEEYDTGWFIETIKPGAFSRALKEKQDVRCLFNHDPNMVLGRSTKSKTLRMKEDKDGLQYDCDLPDTTVGRDVATLIDRGDLSGCSFAFVVTASTWRDVKDQATGRMNYYRDIEDLDLYDVGPVTYPAYEGTSVSARSAEGRTKMLAQMFPDGIPEEIRSHVPGLVERAKCTCDCPECEDGDCANCSDTECNSAACSHRDDSGDEDRARLMTEAQMHERTRLSK